MNKKAGILVGMVFIILVLVLNWMFNGNSETDTKAEGTKQPSAYSVNQDNTVKDEADKVPSTPVEEKPPTSVQQVETFDSTKGEKKKVFKEIEVSDLGKPVISRTEVMVVSKKKVIVLDGDAESSEGKQLVYAVDLLTGDETLSLYINGVTFEQLRVGDKLKVVYNVHKNDANVDFPVIMSVDRIE